MQQYSPKGKPIVWGTLGRRGPLTTQVFQSLIMPLVFVLQGRDRCTSEEESRHTHTHKKKKRKCLKTQTSKQTNKSKQSNKQASNQTNTHARTHTRAHTHTHTHTHTLDQIERNTPAAGFERIYMGFTSKARKIDERRCLVPWMDEFHFAPPKKPWNVDSPCKYQQIMVSNSSYRWQLEHDSPQTFLLHPSEY